MILATQLRGHKNYLLPQSGFERQDKMFRFGRAGKVNLSGGSTEVPGRYRPKANRANMPKL